MELVYLWVEKYKNIKNQGFNFSPRFTCKYENGELTIEEKKSYVSIFPENINVTAIVGENGSGKSSLLNYIYNFLEKSYHYGDEETLHTHQGSDFAICKKDELLIKGDRYGIYNNDYILLNNDIPIDCVLIDFDNEVIESSRLPSMDYLVKFAFVLSKKDDILKYFDGKFIFKKFQLQINRDDIAKFKPSQREYEEILSTLKDRLSILIKKSIEIQPKNEFNNNELMYKTNNIELEVKISFLIKYLYYLDQIFIHNLQRNDDFIEKEKNYFKDIDFENMFKKIREFDAKINSIGPYSANLEIEIVAFEKIIEIIKKSKNIKMESQYRYDKNFNTEYEASVTFDIKNDYIIIKKIIEEVDLNLKYGNIFECFKFDFLSYDNDVKFFELSSGEQSLIKKYMLIIYEILEGKETILLDEPDVLLHPNWAKNFLKKLVDIISNDSIFKEKKVHIVLSTHSPFLLSDLPKENIIFLKNGEQVCPDIQTFGANIHTLLSHGFFMEDGLMGEFAKGKIEEIKKFYELVQKMQSRMKKSKTETLVKKSFKRRKERFYNIQKIIGEPFLKTVIKNYLDELERIFLNTTMIDKELELLEKRKKHLEKLKNAQN